jgi:glycosyltransferase involved in cell wall biosynthesis
MLAPNSDQLPSAMVKWLPPYLTGLLSPSAWGATVLQRFFSLPVKVCPHGVSKHFAPLHRCGVIKAAVRRASGLYVVLHMTSTNAQRKGTREMLDAWKLWRETSARLLVVAPREGIAEQRYWVSSRGLDATVKVIAAGELGAGERLAERMAAFDLVCQPSRAEGFGLLPLEARALGVPVAATKTTGHSEHFPQTDAAASAAGCVLIGTGPDAPVDDFPGAQAPSLSVESVLAALDRAFRQREELSAAALAQAEKVAADWSWTAKTGPVLQELDDG